jgi:hypothetical protein
MGLALITGGSRRNGYLSSQSILIDGGMHPS